jgi:hypothetical protein
MLKANSGNSIKLNELPSGRKASLAHPKNNDIGKEYFNGQFIAKNITPKSKKSTFNTSLKGRNKSKKNKIKSILIILNCFIALGKPCQKMNWL